MLWGNLCVEYSRVQSHLGPIGAAGCQQLLLYNVSTNPICSPTIRKTYTSCALPHPKTSISVRDMDNDPELPKVFSLRKRALSALHREPFESPELRKHGRP
ncbi:hypothetical protein K503DRAFT_482981 [Rhizopogon vinicolor AM-OR11-026]|uniref:Uncharacterized protein n=1 Tax=Rhizopogon vinicolor AM-OR11-026 TaxID=1314800 RepID=A0A1B7MMU6_9AGAM|nr:hypothetical protein K503DRAFT_482981 [Rhizopogon vinicolor AM-OR11-026]